MSGSRGASPPAARPAARPAIARPHVRELLADSLSPVEAYRRLAPRSRHRFLFESVTGGEQVSRFSFLGAGPRAIYRLWADRLEVEVDGRTERVSGEPLTALRSVVSAVEAAPDALPHLPFSGGLVGFFGFDFVRLIERLEKRPPDPFGLPFASFGRFDDLVVFDHAQRRISVIANEIEGETTRQEAEERLAELVRALTSEGGSGAAEVPVRPPAAPRDAAASLDGAAFRAAVERAQEYIAAGDVFQVVLARRFSIPRRVEPLALYRALRLVNPSPYMVLCESPEVSLVGASPEMLVRKIGSRVEVRPIAGTRPRSADPAADRALAEELLADPKERAEHVMLVDLGRNDLGRVAAAGSVRVAELMQIERYSHVMHIVSSVAAELPAERSGIDGALDALLACFPAGTVSGAPKIRAMEIIDELEPEARGPYSGAVGYLSYSGDLDTCITIRTLVVRDGETSVTAGAGIVADSVPAAEERETENKAAALLAAVGLAEELEGA